MDTGSHESGVPAIDISDLAVDDFLASKGGYVEGLIRRMEDAEAWPVDTDPQVQAAIERFCREVTRGELSLMASNPTPELVEVLSYIGAGRFFLFLDELTRAVEHWGLESADLFVHAFALSGPPEAQRAIAACLARITHLERCKCLREVYGADRAQALATALMEIADA